MHTVICTAANVNDVTQGHALLHGEEQVVFADRATKAPANDPTPLAWIGVLTSCGLLA